jgi:hypothetical protein
MEESITQRLLTSLSLEVSRVAAMFATMDIVSSGPLEARGAQGTASWSE